MADTKQVGTELPEKRHTTVHNRYEISDSICGRIDGATSLKQALHVAAYHALLGKVKGGNSCPEIVIFDLMARYDCAETWDAEGKILTFRHRG